MRDTDLSTPLHTLRPDQALVLQFVVIVAVLMVFTLAYHALWLVWLPMVSRRPKPAAPARAPLQLTEGS